MSVRSWSMMKAASRLISLSFARRPRARDAWCRHQSSLSPSEKRVWLSASCRPAATRIRSRLTASSSAFSYSLGVDDGQRRLVGDPLDQADLLRGEPRPADLPHADQDPDALPPGLQ